MKQREHWGSKLGFIMATAGSAIGLGSMWKFPYVTGENGGGIFVLFYIAFTLLIGIPLFIGELIIGRSTGRGPILAFEGLSKRAPAWKSVGWLTVLTSFLLLSYYNVVAGWTLNYTLLSISQFTEGRTPSEISRVFDVMLASADINLFWHVGFMLLTAGVVYGGVRKGIEFWTRIMTPALFTLLILLFIYSTTLDGFGEAVRFLFVPDMAKFKPSSILEALGLSFFTLSVALGILITYGSYMRKGDAIPKTAMLIGGISISISLLAALTIFPIIFTFGMSPEQGVGLIFKTLPVLFSQLPGTLIISTVFFVLLIFTTLTSTVSMLEAIVANLMELTEWPRKKSVIVAASAVLIVGIPSALANSDTLFSNWKVLYGMNFFDTLSNLIDNWMLPLGGLGLALFLGWHMDRKLLLAEFKDGSKISHTLFLLWFNAVRWLAPLGILAVLLQKSGIIDINSLFIYI